MVDGDPRTDKDSHERKEALIVIVFLWAKIRPSEKNLKLIAGVHECDLDGEAYKLLRASAGALAKASSPVQWYDIGTRAYEISAPPIR